MKLRKDHDLGSGYPSDPVTVKFVTKYYKKNREMPKFVRKSWKPVQRIIENN
jgi:ribonuclease HII